MVKNIGVLNPNTNETSEIEMSFEKEVATLKWSSNDLESKLFKVLNYFECIGEVRSYLNSKGWVLQCYGALLNIYPSRMSNQSGGQKAYILETGKQATRDRLVNIFDYCSVTEYYSFEDQQEFYKNWLSSLG